MDSNDILGAIEAGIHQRFPGEPVVRDRWPKNFVRPAFLLECAKDELAYVNIGLVRKTATVLVTCLVELDDRKNSSRAELNRRMDAVLGLFGKGYLPVGDRAVQVSSLKGTGDPDWTEVQSVLTWVDDRPGYRDPEAATPETGGAPLMEHFELSANRKE